MDCSELNHFIDAVFTGDQRDRIASAIATIDGLQEVDPVTTNTAYSYVRFSSRGQAEGDSLRRQTVAAAEYAAKHGLLLDNSTYQDLGISAFKGQNLDEGRLGAFISAIDAGAIKPGATLIVESLDRLSRANVDQALELFLGIIRRGVTIVTLTDGQSYSTERIRQDRGISLIISITVMIRAHEESATKSKRVKEAWDNKRISGEVLTAMCPPWLQLKEDRKTWGVLQDQADKVKRIFDEALAGSGAPSIARKLNQEGIRPFRAEDWTSGTVFHVLRNEAVIGTYTPGKSADRPPVKGYYPAIVEEATFISVQNAISARRGRSGGNSDNVTNLFTGLCYCACGARMRYVSSNKPHVYLQCKDAYGATGKCDAPTMPYGSLNKGGFERAMLLDLWIDKEVAISHLQVNTEGSKRLIVEGQLELKEQQLANLVEAVMSGTKWAVAAANRVEAEIEELKKQRADIVEQPKMSDILEQNVMYIQELNRSMINAKKYGDPIPMRRAVRSSMQQLIERITFNKETIEVDGRECRSVVVTLNKNLGNQQVPITFPLLKWGFGRKRAEKVATPQKPRSKPVTLNWKAPD